MKPYYEEAGITIYHGDCREVLSSLPKVDLVLTDPPYGIGESARTRSKETSNPWRRRAPHQTRYVPPGTNYGASDWDNQTCPDAVQLAILMGKKAIVFGGNYYVLPPSRCWLVWDKDNGESDFADCELAWTNLDGAVRKFRWRWCGMIQEIQNKAYADKRVHPTQKPLALMKWCLGFAPDAKTVLDPFMGSGTTLRAAKDLGRKAIGIEIEERYCEIAANRLRQEVLQFEVAV